jgi:hypothetical protein
VRRHHQEDQVVDDLGVDVALPLLARGAAESAEHVRGVADTPLRDQPPEEVHHELAPPESPVELEPGNPQPDDRHRGRHRCFERRVQALRLRPEIDAEKDRAREIERQRLERGIGEERAALPVPAVDHRPDLGRHAGNVLAQRRVVERDLHDAPVMAMVGAVAQQESVGEDAPHDEVPGALGGELLLLVEEHEAVGVGPEERDERREEAGAHERDRAVAVRLVAQQLERAGSIEQRALQGLEPGRLRNRRRARPSRPVRRRSPGILHPLGPSRRTPGGRPGPVRRRRVGSGRRDL